MSPPVEARQILVVFKIDGLVIQHIYARLFTQFLPINKHNTPCRCCSLALASAAASDDPSTRSGHISSSYQQSYFCFHDRCFDKRSVWEFHTQTGKWTHIFKAPLPQPVTLDVLEINNKAFAGVKFVQQHAESTGNVASRLCWFETFAAHSELYQLDCYACCTGDVTESY
eukprot:scaffold133756_cov56-Cyclotella_meneghiniana.AAC.3